MAEHDGAANMEEEDGEQEDEEVDGRPAQKRPRYVAPVEEEEEAEPGTNAGNRTEVDDLKAADFGTIKAGIGGMKQMCGKMKEEQGKIKEEMREMKAGHGASCTRDNEELMEAFDGAMNAAIAGGGEMARCLRMAANAAARMAVETSAAARVDQRSAADGSAGTSRAHNGGTGGAAGPTEWRR
ncbi:hypothetical protein niasHT_026356 [Heterodera trifolii]|uniref:Uncharacterized protein n=1 Tax=Heterodera trifolii TaxID=157864 RepID=A0ABD2KPS8_9BILA